MWPAIIAAAASTAAKVYDTVSGQKSAQSQQDFQARMSNSAHFREVRDLRRAGLNPILSARYGGESTPSGTSFSPTTSQGVSDAVNSAVSVNKASNDNQLLKQQLDNVWADTQQKMSQDTLNVQNAKAAAKQPELMDAQIINTLAQARGATAGAVGSEADNVSKKLVADFMEAHPWLKNTSTTLNALGVTGGGMLNSAGSVLKKAPIVNRSYNPVIVRPNSR